MKTNRGFEVKHFKDAYGEDCSIQESSAVDPHIWLGVHRPEVKVMWKDVPALVEAVQNIKKDYPETNEWGWCTVAIPNHALITSRMHLNVEQAKRLVKELQYFIKYKELEAEP